MTPAELKALILALPADHPARVAFAAGRDADCAAALEVPALPGYVSRRDLVVVLTNYGQVDGLIRWVLQFGEMPAPMGGGAADFGFYCLCQRISRIAANDVGVLLMIEDLDAAIPFVQPLIDAGAIPQAFFDALRAREIKLPRAVVTPVQVETARRLN